jgi:glucosylceramidase
MKYLLFFVVSIVASGMLQAQNSSSDKGLVSVWYSSELLPESALWYTDPPAAHEIEFKLAKQPALEWTSRKATEEIVFEVNPEKTFQSLMGIGMSLDATSVYAIWKNRNEAQVREMIRMFIDPERGAGFNMFRICIGTSDFSDGRSVSDHPQGYYTYQDKIDDTFSIRNDSTLKIIQTIQILQEEAEGLGIGEDITFFASIWSPPPWMKTSNSLIGGTLKDGFEPTLAKYYRSFIEEYAKCGIPIHAITIQNEPNFTPKTYPGMRLSPTQERKIVEATYEEFNKKGSEIDTRIWINDHNMNHWKNALKVLEGLQKRSKLHYADAAAFHNYNPMASPDNMSKLHKAFPTIDIQLTEHSEWGVKGMYNIQRYFFNWSRSYNYWVPVTTIQLDEHNQGPYNDLKSLSPTLIIEKGEKAPDWYATPEFYMISQFSKFIRPGAMRLESTFGDVKALTSIVFKNADGTFVQVIVNQTPEKRTFTSVLAGRQFNGSVPAKSIATFVW